MQEKTEIQDYPIPDNYFTVPMTQVFDLLAQEFIDFRQKRPAWVPSILHNLATPSEMLKRCWRIIMKP